MSEPFTTANTTADLLRLWAQKHLDRVSSNRKTLLAAANVLDQLSAGDITKDLYPNDNGSRGQSDQALSSAWELVKQSVENEALGELRLLKELGLVLDRTGLVPSEGES